MNPYLLVASLVALIAVGGVAGYEGHLFGIAQQKAADQGEFDKINADLSKQKTEAAAQLAKANADIIALVAQRARLTANLEKDHANAQAATDALRREFAGVGLRFGTTQDTACRSSGRGAEAPAQGPSIPLTTTVVQLPAKVTGDLRQLVADADALRDNYALCYAWATSKVE